MANQNDEKPGQLNVELPEEMADGIYSNLALIRHSSAEFILDFILAVPGTPKAKVKSRIILTPQHAKRFLHVLGENINHYENANGPIKASDPGSGSIPMNFGGPPAQA